MSEAKTIAISGIAVAIHRLRALRPDKVDALAQSMTDQGLLQPIVVRPHKGGGYLLVAGLHRLEAAKKLKWKKITCTVFDDMEADEAELVEIDENLIRADLSPAERALQIGRRQKLYEKRHGKAKARGGHASQAAQGHKANAKLAVAFTKDATKKGIAPRSVELCEASAAVKDVKRPSRFGQQRGCSFPFRSEQQARLVRPEVA